MKKIDYEKINDIINDVLVGCLNDLDNCVSESEETIKAMEDSLNWFYDVLKDKVCEYFDFECEDVNIENIYDNGEYLLGQVDKIINYSEKVATSDNKEDVYELNKHLRENYNDNDIVCMCYDSPNFNGYEIVFTQKNILKESD